MWKLEYQFHPPNLLQDQSQLFLYSDSPCLAPQKRYYLVSNLHYRKRIRCKILGLDTIEKLNRNWKNFQDMNLNRSLFNQ